MIFNCPGANRVKHPEPQDVICPSCGKAVEIWTDEVETVCWNCKATVKVKKAQSCLDWCKYAKICAGYRLVGRKKRLRKNRR